jgi:hypothetical protein
MRVRFALWGLWILCLTASAVWALEYSFPDVDGK